MNDETTKRCAHADCSCMLRAGSIVEREGRAYCSERCADDRGCDHAGCNCGAFPTEERSPDERAPSSR